VSLVVLGVNHRTAPLALLERAVVAAEDAPKLGRSLLADGQVAGAVVVATCNRIEIYLDAERFHDAFAAVRDALVDTRGVDAAELNASLLALWEEEAVHHLFSVAAGLDSAVLGEHEILGQVRDAWQAARDEATLTPSLDRLFQRAVEVGKRVRTETAIGRGTVSVGHAAVEFAARRLGGLAGRRVVVVGAGAMAQVMVGGLARQQSDVVVVNRTAATAATLAAEVGGRGCGLDGLAAELVAADAMLVAVSGPEPVVDAGLLSRAVAARLPAFRAEAEARVAGPLVVDLGLPRNVDPDARSVAGVEVADLEDLRRFSEEGLASRRLAAADARDLVDDAARRFAGERSARGVDPVVAGLRAWSEEIRQAELARYRGRLGLLDDAGRALVDELTRTLLAKLLHGPTMQLKDAAGTPRGARLVEAAGELFPLGDS
jgi:glutamyl-tRNA reductase